MVNRPPADLQDRNPLIHTSSKVDAWFRSYQTGRDPIFWLHHANIDRLWSRWLRTKTHINPPVPQWLNELFEFGNGQWYTQLGANDVLNTTATPLRYRYDDERPRPTTALEILEKWEALETITDLILLLRSQTASL